MMMALNFKGHIFCKINKEKLRKVWRNPRQWVVTLATLMRFSSLLQNSPHPSMVSRATKGTPPKAGMNVLVPICRARDQSWGCNSSAGKMDKTRTT